MTGTGVTVGVLSDGVDSLPASIASGDLPADTRVLPGQEGDGDEGTAMMEIVHDLAPNAHLDLRDGVHQRGELRGQHPGAARGRRRRHRRRRRLLRRVAVPGQRPAQAVIDVTNDGALYFSSAGNEQNVDDRHRRQLGGRLRPGRPDDRQVRRRGPRLGSGPAHPGAQPGLRRLRRRADDPAVERPAGSLRQRLRPVRGGSTAPWSGSPTTSRTATTTRSRASTCRSAPSAWPW